MYYTEKLREIKISNIIKSLYLPSFFYALLVVFIPWEIILKQAINSSFQDRYVYVNYIQSGLNIINYSDFNSIFDYISKEYLWHFMLKELVQNDLVSVNVFFDLISFFYFYVSSLLCLKYKKWWALFFLINPLTVNLAFSQIRNAFSIALLISAFLSRHKIISILCLILSCFIHTSSVLFISIYFFVVFIYNLLKNHKPYYIILSCVLGGFTIGLLISLFSQDILSALGDRRANYNAPSSSILFLSFWIILFFLCVLDSGTYYKNIIHLLTIFILAWVIIQFMFGGYSNRIIACGYPLFLITALDGKGLVGRVIFIFYIVYSLSQWIFWLQI